MREKSQKTTGNPWSNFVDGITLLFLYLMVTYAAEGRDVLTLTKLATYFGLFGVCTFAMWTMDADYADALNRGAAMVIAGKLLATLNPAT